MAESILIFRPDHLGDVLLTTPALRLLREARPDARIVMAVGQWSREVIAGNPHVDAIVDIDLPWLARHTGANWSACLRSISHLRAQHFDVVFNFRVAAKSAVVTRMLGARDRWGFDAPKSAWAHNHRIPGDLRRHAVDNYCDLMRGYVGDAPTPDRLEFFGADTHQTAVAGRLRQAGIAGPFLICAPGAGYAMKCWPIDRWVALVDALHEIYNWPVILTGSSGERLLCDAIKNATSHRIHNFAGRCGIGELAALLARAHGSVTVDSFTMHLAAAQGTPLVALFGPTNHRHWGPWPGNPNQIVVTRNPDGPFHKQDSETARTLMTQITTADVLAAVKRVLQHTPER